MLYQLRDAPLEYRHKQMMPVVHESRGYIRLLVLLNIVQLQYRPYVPDFRGLPLPRFTPDDTDPLRCLVFADGDELNSKPRVFTAM